jgi:hypothetical protein
MVLLPAITSHPPPNDLECALFDLPTRLGGLGFRFPSYHADREYYNSQSITKTLSDHILDQDDDYSYDVLNDQIQHRAQVSRENIPG